MKKITLLCLVVILLAVSVVPVMAAGPNNGHGNGVGGGHGNSGGDQTRQRDQDGSTNPGLSGNGNQDHTRMRTPFYLQGTISALDTTTKTITVTVIHGNARVKEYIGTTLPVQTTATTRMFKITQGADADTAPNKVPIQFGEFAIGQKVAIHGNLANNVYTATLITVYIKLSNGESETGTP